jgi:anti-anti-sigma factor
MGTSASPPGASGSSEPSRARESSRPSPRAPEVAAFELGVEQEGNTLHLRFAGEFDRACVGRVEAALGRISAALTRVVLDLRGLTFLDLAGLRTILEVHQRARREQFDLIVVRPRGTANRVFALTRVGERLGLVDRVPAANGSG